MTDKLSLEDFGIFFKEVHGHSPFPWQVRLARKVAEEGSWPEVLDLPTGSGKTSALDVAIFHLALEAGNIEGGAARRAPARIVLVVDRRLVVDDAFARARKIAEALERPAGVVTDNVARRLKLLAGKDAKPLLSRRLRGGIPREDDWARTPSQPTILCSTVDQVGSRLLFRGYGISNSMKPVQAGLFGSDCLILLDEAHFSEPFRQTLGWVRHYKGGSWRESKDAVAPWGLSLLTATPGGDASTYFRLEDEDYTNPILSRRWNSSKPARLIELAKLKKSAGIDDEAAEPEEVAEKQRIDRITGQAREALSFLRKGGIEQPALGIVVNRVTRARAVFEELREEMRPEENEVMLMIGPSRSVERGKLVDKFKSIRTGNGDERILEKTLVIVSTQCIEAGVDIDLDGLVTEASPLDSLRQRFGRLNRAGREIIPYAAIIGSGTKTEAEDPVYGDALVRTWAYLTKHPDMPASKGGSAEVDFGLRAFEERRKDHPIDRPDDLLSPKQDAPVLLPAHLDLLSQTSPIPTADPEISLYLHGPSRAPDSVSVVWRADIDPLFPDGTHQLMVLAPPRAAEAIELPVWAVCSWLEKQRASILALADVPISVPEAHRPTRRDGDERRIFHWTGDWNSSAWISPREIRPGDTVIIPAAYGGVDEYGWNPNADAPEPAKDVASQAASPFAGRRFTVRVAPGLLDDPVEEASLAQAIASTREWKSLRDAIKAIRLPSELAEDLDKLDFAKGKGGSSKVEVYSGAYGYCEDCPRGVVFFAPLGIEVAGEGGPQRGESSNATEDDIAGSLPGFELPLERHCLDVEKMVGRFSKLAGLSDERILDLRLAGYLHDAGKVDSRFQAWLTYGDPLGPDPNCPDKILAKSPRPLPRNSREYSGLPANWRHEALSVRLALHIPRLFAEAQDLELVLWLVGTHHGYGRPLFPHADPGDTQTRTNLPSVLGIPERLLPGPGPQSLAFDWQGLDWPSLYELLKARYGVWELARMEAVLRLSDHRASELAATRSTERGVTDQ